MKKEAPDRGGLAHRDSGKLSAAPLIIYALWCPILKIIITRIYNETIEIKLRKIMLSITSLSNCLYNNHDSYAIGVHHTL